MINGLVGQPDRQNRSLAVAERFGQLENRRMILVDLGMDGPPGAADSVDSSTDVKASAGDLLKIGSPVSQGNRPRRTGAPCRRDVQRELAEHEIPAETQSRSTERET